MTNQQTIPSELNNMIGAERKDFAIKAGLAQPIKKNVSTAFSGLVLIGFVSMFIFQMFAPLFQGRAVNYTVNGVAKSATMGDAGGLVFPGVILGIFLVLGIFLFAKGIFGFFKKGGYFVGTSDKLFHYQKGEIKAMNWEQFSGNITVKGKAQKGEITLELRTGKMVKQKNGPDRYVPEVVYISDVPDVFAVEKICRQRMKEHDPTPVNTGDGISL
ncbi:hypothetical protein KKG22_03120 [Patescibacteria group bacterium]|nr:hypothetical protein [Patescibacteria group bacterium]MBU1721369.1 hypothetical protein [Patescibacteria group bacterium]